jgi:hypothetical protein
MTDLLKYALNNNSIFLALLIVACGGLTYLTRWVLVTSRDREAYLQKANDDREARYVETIRDMTDKLGVIDVIANAVARIENKLEAKL